MDQDLLDLLVSPQYINVNTITLSLLVFPDIVRANCANVSRFGVSWARTQLGDSFAREIIGVGDHELGRSPEHGLGVRTNR